MFLLADPKPLLLLTHGIGSPAQFRGPDRLVAIALGNHDLVQVGQAGEIQAVVRIVGIVGGIGEPVRMGAQDIETGRSARIIHCLQE